MARRGARRAILREHAGPWADPGRPALGPRKDLAGTWRLLVCNWTADRVSVRVRGLACDGNWRPKLVLLQAGHRTPRDAADQLSALCEGHALLEGMCEARCTPCAPPPSHRRQTRVVHRPVAGDSALDPGATRSIPLDPMLAPLLPAQAGACAPVAGGGPRRLAARLLLRQRRPLAGAGGRRALQQGLALAITYTSQRQGYSYDTLMAILPTAEVRACGRVGAPPLAGPDQGLSRDVGSGCMPSTRGITKSSCSRHP